jgi:polysaccharide deacetylase 2 family uncharacterized protein YibQ
MGLLSLRALGLFWVAMIAALAGAGGYLAWLGPLPPAEPPRAEAPAVPEPAPPEPPPAALQRAEAAPAAPLTPVALPVAPPPPPLAEARARPALAEPVIAPPDPALLEPSRHGALPRLGPERRSSIRTYARAFDREDPRPRVALILGNLGMHGQHSEEAIRRLPGAVTLAFSPYAQRPEPLLDRARARGMELLISLPMESEGHGLRADPGDRALLTALTIGDNLDRLDWALSRIQGQVGVLGALIGMRGERFAANAELLGTVQATVTNRGLLYVDARPGAPSPALAFGRTVDLVLDEPPTRGEVERRLRELEEIARANGSALGYAGDPLPSVVAAIAAWGAGVEERGLVIAPVTALIRRPTAQPQ